jgi:stage II sporulation protein D
MKTKRDNYWVVHVILIVILVFFIVLTLLTRDKQEEIIRADVVEKNDIDTVVPLNLTLSMYNHETNKAEIINIDDYVVGVLSAEMPASYDPEALKAQSIAIRTLAFLAMKQKRGCYGCDVCSDSTHCQAYADVDKRKTMWGSDFDKWQSKIDAAAYDTRGMIMTYNNKPIEVFYHASSNGMTEDSQVVFTMARPYLVSVESPDVGLNSYTKRFTYESFAGLLNKSISGLKLSKKNVENNIKITSHTNSGRVDTLVINGKSVSGVAFRRALGIQSTTFELEFYDNTVQITTMGFGHGVGMSQKGANTMAKNGSSYKEILEHYYKGIKLNNINEK